MTSTTANRQAHSPRLRLPLALRLLLLVPPQLPATGCAAPRLPSVQLFVERRVHAEHTAAPTGAMDRRHAQALTAGLRLAYVLDRRGGS